MSLTGSTESIIVNTTINNRAENTMADITTYPFVRHLRAAPTAHVLRWRKGRLVKDARGPTFWFRPLHAAVAEIPVDDRELPFLFHARSADFQELTVQGAVTFRVAVPA